MVCAGNQVGKMLGGHWIFEKVQFEIHDGDRIGLVGANGSGKTTLLKCLHGTTNIDRGEIFLRKKSRIGYLAQSPEYPAQITVKEVLRYPFAHLMKMEKRIEKLAEQMGESYADEKKFANLMKEWDLLQQRFADEGGYQMESQIARVANGLGIDESMWALPFCQLSGGEKTKVGLATILLSNPDLLLLDEPTNHLDLTAIEWLEDYLKQFSGAVVVVSHDRYFLDRVTQVTWDLENGELTSYQGNYTSYTKQKEERLLTEFQAYQEQEKKIKKMREAIKRLKDWANRGNPPNDGMHRRAKSMEKALNRMEKIEKPMLERKKIALNFSLKGRSGNDVLVLENVTKSYGDTTLYQDINLTIRYKERCAIVGGNGTGKSTLLKMIQGKEQADQGKIRLGVGVKVGFLSQDDYEDDPEQTVLDTFREHVTVSIEEARHILARFLFYGYAVFRKIKDLSGGERVRLRLAQLMYQDVNFLILDEPTNHLDIDSREVLEEALFDFPGTILVVSHDRYFLNRLFSRIYWLDHHRMIAYEGNYDQAKQKRDEK
ncbi:ABC-F type ribosomal protection protein [Thermoflavimicrobium daqui]|uniref:ABC-F type ribosomal protection protein n=1 Tax=Thermoflavimicrobium daqui TaxID=2137476 RepID=A0A364K5F6_9BACL|nr:ABC-F type ribosomal protection protein [Thermoflavimicrobium daqui]